MQKQQQQQQHQQRLFVPGVLFLVLDSGTEVAQGAICLRACYAMSGTDILYGATAASAAPRDRRSVNGAAKSNANSHRPSTVCTSNACFAFDFALNPLASRVCSPRKVCPVLTSAVILPFLVLYIRY
eukprot:328578-Rhodomonas_salina.2